MFRLSVFVFLLSLCLTQSNAQRWGTRQLSQVVRSSASSSSSSTSMSSSTSTGFATATSSSSASGGGSAVSTADATSMDGGTAVAVSDAEAKDGGTAESAATAEATGGETAIARASALSDEANRKATAVSTAIADETGPASATSIAQAIGDGFGDAVAVAVGNSVDAGLKDEAATALTDAYSIAVSEGAGDAYAGALALGLASDESTRSAYAFAVSKVLKAEGCDNFRPTLANARAVAINDGKEREFVDAVDFDIQIAECLLEPCGSAVMSCCGTGATECECTDDGCAYTLWKNTPRDIWNFSEDDSKCICPSAV